MLKQNIWHIEHLWNYEISTIAKEINKIPKTVKKEFFIYKPLHKIREIKITNHPTWYKGPDFMEGGYLLYLTTLPGLVAIRIVVVEIKYF